MIDGSRPTDPLPIVRSGPPGPWGPAATAPAPRRTARTGVLLGLPGLILILVGAFLPWLISGTVRRSSFAVAGVADRLGVADGLGGTLVAAWPAICASFVLPVLVAAFRCWRTAGFLAVLLGLLAGGLAGTALWFGLAGSASVVRLDLTGPSVMLTGALLFIAGGIALLRSHPLR
ncbi:hypothetical protein FDO65_03240 [Nakamurella flava]|uniref:Uncharacterized protein n=1 Tax=Nakamurella flava TaxID=2576308 RepID=A0A4U6QKS2_9ACTN|nr:hypothetical protein [Nakamurella flava]TKV60712.1 hypothetical protein FDO65_03240 [Nakamurella flava]